MITTQQQCDKLVETSEETMLQLLQCSRLKAN